MSDKQKTPVAEVIVRHEALGFFSQELHDFRALRGMPEGRHLLFTGSMAECGDHNTMRDALRFRMLQQMVIGTVRFHDTGNGHPIRIDAWKESLTEALDEMLDAGMLGATDL